MATEKNHYIPQFYLRGWASNAGQLFEYARRYQGQVAARPTHPKGTGYQKGLYKVAGLPPEGAHWIEEEFLFLTDDRASKALGLMLDDKLAEVQGELKNAWSRFIISIWNRNPEKIAWLKKIWRNHNEAKEPIFRKMFEEKRQDGDPATYDEWKALFGPEAEGRLLVNLMQRVMDLPQVGQFLNDMRWGVITVQDAQHSFMTSDRPILKPFPFIHDDAHIAMPISPTKLFVAVKRDATLELIKRNGRAPIIVKSNAMIACQAATFVYGHTDRMTAFVDRRLNRDPEALHWATFQINHTPGCWCGAP